MSDEDKTKLWKQLWKRMIRSYFKKMGSRWVSHKNASQEKILWYMKTMDDLKVPCWWIYMK